MLEPVCLSVNVTSIMASSGVWVLLALEMNVNMPVSFFFYILAAESLGKYVRITYSWEVCH